MLKTADIHIRDPFILPDEWSRTYYLYGTTEVNGSGTGFVFYTSKDLEKRNICNGRAFVGGFQVERPVLLQTMEVDDRLQIIKAGNWKTNTMKTLAISIEL